MSNQEYTFDLLRGIAAYTGNDVIAALAHTEQRHPDAELDYAFNHKQIASKLWARDRLVETLGPKIDNIWILGGWYGVLAAVLLDEPKLEVGSIINVDIDESVGPIALTLNETAVKAGKFENQIADMYNLDYAGAAERPGLIINTSCEHIADIAAWLDLIPKGTPVLMQSNNMFDEPSHINCVENEDALAAQAQLSEVLYKGALPLKRYTRFMLIGRR